MTQKLLLLGFLCFGSMCVGSGRKTTFRGSLTPSFACAGEEKQNNYQQDLQLWDDILFMRSQTDEKVKKHLEWESSELAKRADKKVKKYLEWKSLRSAKKEEANFIKRAQELAKKAHPTSYLLKFYLYCVGLSVTLDASYQCFFPRDSDYCLRPGPRKDNGVKTFVGYIDAADRDPNYDEVYRYCTPETLQAAVLNASNSGVLNRSENIYLINKGLSFLQSMRRAFNYRVKYKGENTYKHDMQNCDKAINALQGQLDYLEAARVKKEQDVRLFPGVATGLRKQRNVGELFARMVDLSAAMHGESKQLQTATQRVIEDTLQSLTPAESKTVWEQHLSTTRHHRKSFIPGGF